MAFPKALERSNMSELTWLNPALIAFSRESMAAISAAFELAEVKNSLLNSASGIF